MKESLKILVTGATGQQGGSAAKALLAEGHHIRALSRDPQSERSVALRRRGIEVVQGNFEDRDSLETALDGMDGAFLMGTPFEAGIEAEINQGMAFAEAARSVKVPHLVYSSVAGAEQNTGIPHFDSKYLVERHIQSLDIPYTIIAPVYFYDNMLSPFVLPGLQNGTLAQALAPDIGLQSISVQNIGEFIAMAFTHKDRFLGKRIEIAGDELTGSGYADGITHASGKKIDYFEVPIEQIRSMSLDMALMYEWFAKVGYSVPLAQLRQKYPEVNWESFAEWAARQDWALLNKA